jgi:hypothetical protein
MRYGKRTPQLHCKEQLQRFFAYDRLEAWH